MDQPSKTSVALPIALAFALGLSALAAASVAWAQSPPSQRDPRTHSGGAAVVGTHTLAFKDPVRQRAVTSELWFAAANGTEPTANSLLPPISPIVFAMGAEAAPDFLRRPLVVISHGNWGTRYGHGSMAIELVRAGFAVLSVSHPGTMNGDLKLEGRIRQWDRAADVSFALSQLLADARWQALVDPARIGFVGHSFGGTTGVQLAGGNWSWPRQVEACGAMASKDQFCTNMMQADTSGVSLDGMAASYRDPRIKSFYIMGSGPAGGFSAESLQAIKVPVFVDTAKQDDVLEPVANSSRLARAIPTAREVIRDIGHFTYAPNCRPLIGKALAGQICEDPSGVTRREVHQLVNAEAIRFFNGTL